MELDGDAREEREHKDVARDEWMKQRGLAVVRFHNEAVIRERLVVVESIERWLKRRLNEFGMHSKDEGKKSSKMK